MGALAQQVASTPTTWSELTTGNYLVLVKSSKTSDAGNFMYHGSDDYAYVDKKSTGTDLIGSILNTDQQKYIWTVTKSGNTITLMSIENNHYIQGNGKKDDKANVSVNSTKYTVTDKNDGSVVVSYTNGGFMGIGKYTTYLTTNGDGTNADSYIGTSTTSSNAAQFVFYKTSDVEYIDVTYNYTYNDETKYTCTVRAIDGQAFPECNIKASDRPGFVVFGKPEGNFNKAAGVTTFDIALTYNLPFTTSTDEAPVYYYLVNGTDTRHMLYNNNSSVGIREDAQAEQLNNVRNDLWFVKGNPFDGYQFTNVATGNLIHSNAQLSNVFVQGNCFLAFEGAINNTYTWNLYEVDDNSFAVKGDGYYWSYNSGRGQVRFTKDLTIDDNHTFRLIPATITMPLNYSEADDKTFATTCLPYAVEVAEGQDNIKAYAAKLNDEKTELEMKEVAAVPANQGIILSGESASDNEVVLNVIASADAIDNDLLGTTSDMSTDGILALGRANGTGSVGFFRSTNATLKANRAYLKVDETIQSLAMNFGGTTTGITHIIKSEVNPNAPIYDLSGRRVFNMVKGNVYIQNGKKIIK